MVSPEIVGQISGLPTPENSIFQIQVQMHSSREIHSRNRMLVYQKTILSLSGVMLNLSFLIHFVIQRLDRAVVIPVIGIGHSGNSNTTGLKAS